MTLSREQKLAQCFIVGSDEPDLPSAITPFVDAGVGLGGVLLFRQHTQPFQTAEACRDWIAELKQIANLTWVSVDQEGGQVERFPHWFFPTGVQAQLLGKQPGTTLTHTIAQATAQRLAWLGVNLNFAPTVDINTEPRNPIIGARSYGSTADTVMAHAQQVINAHRDAGVLPTIKHFPGHGTSLLDSHHALPVFLQWQSHELEPYKVLLAHQPAVMVAHGLYPDLFNQLEADAKLPASLNPAVIQTLLRQQLGFDGLVLTDDLMMGAVHPDSGDGFDPIEVGFWAWHAGVDLLVYRRAQPEAWAVYQALLAALKQGKLNDADLDARWARIQRAKDSLPTTSAHSALDTTPTTVSALALSWAQQAVSIQPTLSKPLTPESEVFVVYPDPATMVHYAPDADVPKLDGIASPSLVDCLYHADIVPMAMIAYPLQTPNTPSDADLLESLVELPFDVVDDVETIVFIAVNAVLSPLQQDLFYTLKRQFPGATIQLVSVGADSDATVLTGADQHLCLPSYRPASLTVLCQWLTGQRPVASEGLPSSVPDSAAR